MNALVIGSQISGSAAYRALKARGASVAFADETAEVNGIDLVVVSPSVRLNSPVFANCKRCGVRIIGELELGYALAKKPIIAVTGTNGKTTVTRLVALMTGSTACGNIGYALCDAARGVEPCASETAEPCERISENKSADNAPLVVEVSSFQLSTIEEFHPRSAAIINISPDHLNYHTDFKNYCAAKCNIASNMTSHDTLVLGGDVPLNALALLNTDANIVYTALNRRVKGAYTLDGYFYYGEDKVAPCNCSRLLGEHNFKNVLIAIALAKSIGTSNEQIKYALANIQLDPHRIELIASTARQRFFDDSKSTNVASTIAAAKTMFASTALIVCGSDKGLDYSPLIDELLKIETVTTLIVFGEISSDIEKAYNLCENNKSGLSLIRVNDMREAVLAGISSQCANVLLSPASASFDLYGNYKARGDAFAKIVRCLIAK